MRIEPPELISLYLDDLLSEEQLHHLSEWIRESPGHARQFATVALLHDQLRGLLHSAVPDTEVAVAPSVVRHDVRQRDAAGVTVSEVHVRRSGRLQRYVSASAVLAMCAFAVMVAFSTVDRRSASLEASEIQRLIAANEQQRDRTFRIVVEESVLPDRGENRKGPGKSRPPKPSIDSAVLHIRDGSQFVLERHTPDGPFLTGSNGLQSWAIRPGAPVRVSDDLSRFNRDVPGHEHKMTLVSIHEALEQLSSAYTTTLMPEESPGESDGTSVPGAEATRLLVAVRRPKQRGPRRVEIAYAVSSGLIQQMRFVEMPYGPERLSLRMTLVSEQPLHGAFFDHEFHHAADERVEVE